MGGAGGSTTEARCGLEIIGTAAAYRVGHRPELAFDPITEFQLKTYVSLVGACSQRINAAQAPCFMHPDYKSIIFFIGQLPCVYEYGDTL